jgi:hypothetical protein
VCPICWTAALASFGLLVIVSAVVVAGTDKWTLLFSAILLVASLLHRWGWVPVPWWSFLMVMATAINRLGYLLVLNRDGLLICTAWNRARQVAARACPTRRIPPYAVSNTDANQ